VCPLFCYTFADFDTDHIKNRMHLIDVELAKIFKRISDSIAPGITPHRYYTVDYE
jgi:hypothetical protein